MAKRPVTVGYLIFLVLFSDDFWRLSTGVLFSWWLTPIVAQPDTGSGGRVVLYLMITAIGWAISARPARWIVTRLKRAILGDRAGLKP